MKFANFEQEKKPKSQRLLLFLPRSRRFMSISFGDVWEHVKKNGLNPWQDVSNLIIRPPRATYPMAALGPAVFRIQTTDGGKPCSTAFKRHDFTLRSMRDLSIECSWYRPYVATPSSPSSSTAAAVAASSSSSEGGAAKDEAPKTPQAPKETPRPCVVYLHGNSGCRLDGQEILYVMERGFTVMTYDACGSGNSGGEYVSLGIYERTDLATVIDHLRSSGLVTTIALWGRSMGAVTSLMYAARDPTAVNAIVLDSPFSTLRLLISDLVEQHARWAPKFTVEAIVEKVRRVIVRTAGFDINQLNALDAARKCTVPAFIFHGKEDTFVAPKHSAWIADCYQGCCLRHEVMGGHNDERMADARDVALNLLQLYLVDKPAAEAQPERRQMLQEMERQRAQRAEEEKVYVKTMQQLHEEMERNRMQDERDDEEIDMAASAAVVPAPGKDGQKEREEEDEDKSGGAAASAAAAVASPLLNRAKMSDGHAQVTHVRAGESKQNAEARKAGNLELDQQLSHAIGEAFNF